MNPERGPSKVASLRLSQTPAAPTDAPATGCDLRLKQQVADALAASPGGAELDAYFGISSGNPAQSTVEADESDTLLRRLQTASQGQGGDPASLLGDIFKHADGSGADADALRALMCGSRKPKTNNGGKAG